GGRAGPVGVGAEGARGAAVGPGGPANPDRRRGAEGDQGVAQSGGGPAEGAGRRRRGRGRVDPPLPRPAVRHPAGRARSGRIDRGDARLALTHAPRRCLVATTTLWAAYRCSTGVRSNSRSKAAVASRAARGVKSGTIPS